jgi:hypothetical protein
MTPKESEVKRRASNFVGRMSLVGYETISPTLTDPTGRGSLSSLKSIIEADSHIYP